MLKFFKQKKIYIPAIILIVIFLLFQFTKGFIHKDTIPQKLDYPTVTLEKSTFENVVSAEGSLESQSFSNITTTLRYNVTKINVNVGDTVKKGDVIAYLDTSEIDKQIARKQATNQDRQAELDKRVSNALIAKQNAWDDMKKFEKTSGYEDSQEYVQLQRSFASRDGEYAEALEAQKKGIADYELQDLYQSKKDCAIVSKADGTITAINATVGSSVQDGYVASVADIHHLQVRLLVDEYDVQKLSKGLTVKVSSDAANEQATGTVTSISLSAVTRNNTSGYEVIVKLNDETKKMLIGSRVKVKVILEQHEGVYVVPKDAIGYQQDQPYVMLADTLEKMNVTIDYQNSNQVVISGTNIKDGLKVISDIPMVGEQNGK